MKYLEWCVYYGDGSDFSNEDGSPFDAPGRNVQAIGYADPNHGRRIVTKWDYYVWAGREWWGVEIFGLFDYLAEPGEKKVMFGRTLSDVDYELTYQRAVDDPRLPPKTGRRQGERA